MKSTAEKPLDFFEFITNKKTIKDLVDEQIFHTDIIGYKYIDSLNIEYSIMDDYGNHNLKKSHITLFVIPVLQREYENTKNFLYKYSINNPTEIVKNYLKIQFSIIQNIINSRTDFIKEHSYFLLPLRGIVNYINNILLLEGMHTFELDESSLGEVEVVYNNLPQFNTKFETDEEIIYSIFSYMDGLNEKREKILSEEDYNLLIGYIKHLVSKNSLPEINQKLRPNITSDQLSFSFWVLHKELCTTKNINPIFIEFLKYIFENFSNIEINSLRKIFGVKKRVTKDKFLPEIIKKHL